MQLVHGGHDPRHRTVTAAAQDAQARAAGEPLQRGAWTAIGKVAHLQRVQQPSKHRQQRAP